MPDPLVLSEIRLDAEAAAAVTRQLVASAAALAAAEAVLLADRPAATEDFAGPHRRAFDHEFDRLLIALAGGQDHLLAAAAVVGATLAAGEAEQRLRERIRAELDGPACQVGRPC